MSKDPRNGQFKGAWCSYINSLMDERRMKLVQFAQLLQEKSNNLSQYMTGIIRPPPEKLEAWAERMSLTEQEKAKFIHLAQLEHTPDIIRDELARMQQKAALTDRALAQLMRKYDIKPGDLGL